MEERFSKLFRAITEEYIATAQPVGSQTLVERYRLDVSPATVRNWCVELEEAGYLAQPHTSGGRIPTEQGFREYIARFVEKKPIAKRERDVLEKAALVPEEDGRRIKGVAKILADLSHEAVVVGLAEMDTYYTGLSYLFAQPEFKTWQRVVSLSEVLDRLDEALHSLRRVSLDEPKILLGQECPFGPACSSILVSLPNGSTIGILGPLRMDYQQTMSLIHTVQQLFSTNE